MSPYSDLTDVQLIDELEKIDASLKADSEQLTWVEENDEDSGLLDALREGLDHAVADYNWCKKELFDRGFKHNPLTDTWHKDE